MLSLNEKLRAKLQEIPAQKRFLITSHDAFNYFARRYLATAEEIKGDLWQGRVAAPEGLAPDGQLSAADIQYIVDRIKQHRIEVVFPESNVNADALKKIVQCSKSLGISVRLSEAVLFADAMGPPGSEADSYFKMMEWDIDTLFGAWKER
jgi:manganese/zinc/iron transport system substrate-binding protein